MGDSNSPRKKIEREYDWSTTSLTDAILESIAIFEHDDTDMIGKVLELPLPEYIDADALDRVVTNTQPITIEFLLAGYRIRIQDNRIIVTDTEFFRRPI